VARRDLTTRIAVVTQDVQIFDASVRDNITLFDDDVPAADVVDALTGLGLGGWLANLPDGLDTRIVAGRGSLSGGEAQILAFARAFLRDPDIVILDEASSRLDPATERLVQDAVHRLLAGRTALVIAHHLSTLDTVDDIAVMEAGRIIEHGPREVLAGRLGSHFSALLVEEPA
jgi:ABC-type multidrug transport system fused ATPase/permease subunit